MPNIHPISTAHGAQLLNNQQRYGRYPPVMAVVDGRAGKAAKQSGRGVGALDDLPQGNDCMRQAHRGA